MKNHTRVDAENDKLHEALELLNEAAKEKREELSEIIGDKYTHIKDVLTEKADDGFRMAEAARRSFLKTFKVQEKHLARGARQIDKEVRKNPWAFLSGIAAISFLVGKFLRRKSS